MKFCIDFHKNHFFFPEMYCPTLSDMCGLAHSRICYKIFLKTHLLQYLSAQKRISLWSEAKFWQWQCTGCFSHSFNCLGQDVYQCSRRADTIAQGLQPALFSPATCHCFVLNSSPTLNSSHQTYFLPIANQNYPRETSFLLHLMVCIGFSRTEK